MAYEVRWQVNFAARNGDKYRIEILEDGWDEEPVRLLGAESPIETREDNPSDFFTPIRKQTGFIRIVDTGKDLDGNDFNYEDMIPSGVFDFQVRLWLEGDNNNDTLSWIGYMRPDSLTSRLFEYVSIREFTIACPLSVMYDVPFTFSNNNNNKGTVKRIGQILYSALSATGIDWDYVYKQNNISYRDDLCSMVSLFNFIGSTTPFQISTPSGDDPNVFSATWKDDETYLGEIVEEICKFWGWVIYTRSKNIYIVTPGDVKFFAKFPFSDLQSGSRITPTDIMTPAVTLVDEDFVSVNHSTQRLQGHKMIKVVSDVNEHKEIARPNFNELTLDYFPPEQIFHVVYPDTMYFLKRFVGNIISVHARYQYIENLQIYQNTTIQSGGLDVPLVIALTDVFKSDDFPTKTEFNFKSEIVVFQGGQTDSVIFWMQTIDDIIVPAYSKICIVARCYTDISDGNPNYWSPVPSGTPASGKTIKATLKVGDKYWDQANWQWTTQVAYIYLEVRADGSITYPVNWIENGTVHPDLLFDNHYGSAGFCAYTNGEGLCGRMRLAIYKTATGEPTSYSVNCIMTDPSIFIVNENDKMNPVNKSEHIYSKIANNRFLTDYVVSNKISSGSKNNYGLGQLYTPNFQMLETVNVRLNGEEEEQLEPEVNLLNRLRSVYASISRIDTVEVKNNIEAGLPIVQLIINDKTYTPISCSHNWRESKISLTITDQI